MKRLLPLAFVFCTIAASVAQLVGINYNNGSQHNQYLCINPANGSTTVVNCFDYDSGLWFPNSFTTDFSTGNAYAVSSVGTVYTFSLTTGVIQQSVHLGLISAIQPGLSGNLVGIEVLNSGYAFHSINPATGSSVVLNSFAMPGGFLPDSFVTDLATGPAGAQGTAYVISGLHELYIFNVTSGAILNTRQLGSTVAAIGVGMNGYLIGIQSTGTAGQWELHSIDPSTGVSTMLSAVNLPSGVNGNTFKSAPSTNTVYLVSGNTLYSFNLTNGSLIGSSNLATSVQAIAIGPPSPCAPASACCTDGHLDATFNPGPFADAAVTAVVVDPNGKILIGGSFDSFNGHAAATGIARLNPDGSVDTTFNLGGTGTDGVVRDVVLQPDGKILLGGAFSKYNQQPRNGIARLLPDGALDGFFLPGTAAALNTDISAIRLQSTGGILIAGFFTDNSNTVRRIARLSATTGALDGSFNSGAGPNSRVIALSVQSDDKIIIGGDFTTYNGPRSRIARLNADGSLDTNFLPGAGANNMVYATALEPGPPPNKIIIGGAFSNYDGSNIRHRVARLLPNGSLDTSFDANAVTGATLGSAVFAVSVLSNGNILIGGDGFSNSGVRMARLLPNGALDTSFDPGPGTGADDVVLDMAVQPDGKVLIGGEFFAYSGVSLNRIARLCASTAPALLMRSPSIAGGRPRTGDAVVIARFWPFALRVEPGTPPRLRFGWWW